MHIVILALWEYSKPFHRSFEWNKHNRTWRCSTNKCIRQNILKIAKTHQSSRIQLNKKLTFYSLFKQDNKKSRYSDLIKNTNHRRTVAKFRTSNHKLMIEYRRYCTPKIPEHLGLCQYCSLNCTLYFNERQYLLDSISHKYPNFHPLIANDMILFLFNNADPFVCKKRGHFIFLAFEKNESRSLNIATM